MNYKVYKDSIGEIKVDADKLWGATTQRSFENFKIGSYKMPLEVIRAMAVVKYACAMANYELGDINREKFSAIENACEEILRGKLDDHFPLVVFQTGSGTQTNMNLNEVIANFANDKLGKKLIHPNDDVNKSQSSNDTFPTALHIACLDVIDRKLLPSMKDLICAFKTFEKENEDIIKIGRTHLQDAVPIKLSQEFSGYRYSLEKCLEFIEFTRKGLLDISLGATAVGTGINTKPNFKNVVAKYVSKITEKDFKPSDNFFHSLTMKDAVVVSHGAIKALAMDLIKIGNDIRFLACGPRCGFSEIEIPANEPGSSIMPGKVNPTQVEALTMVCAKVLGNDTTISFCASQGNFELNVYMPVIIHCFVESVNLLADAIDSFNKNCIKGIKVNKDKIDTYLRESLMLVTALNPYIGYDKASQCAKYAFNEKITLKEAVLHFGYLTGVEFDKIVDPKRMV
ncbi:MAG: class II fumarate hydratase [Peptoniphilaceae bacterium]|uniref:class II fumarate hydratase n=1 Tax=Parvimonas sp. TaxID=1944660 RepID=UPI0025FE3BDE|nr:class II fumarate hydratase [Parvimonas sp.]MCI5997299.1 class II fumarate hydratase [Parvimonas sp.]MDD7765427.1 class II fumarate hydratase [Peptoniphilaceae bacterium]MDY3050968.1 class II fumarate hydratase [Parvimonas sp.]